VRELIVRDDRELRRVESAIVSIEQNSNGSRLDTHCLLAALKAERNELLRYSGHRRTVRRRGTRTADEYHAAS
jgi:hypothetical protein